MSDVIDFPEIPFGGGCPKCGGNNGFLYVNTKSEWFICHKHRTRWEWGRNLTSNWRTLDADELARQEAIVRQYRTVKPTRSGDYMAEDAV